MVNKLLLICGIALSSALLWFAVSSYRAAAPIAAETLRGVALSITAAVENIASHDPSLRSLDTLRPKDLAFLAIADADGRYRFHSNPDLIGTRTEDPRYPEVLRTGAVAEGRITLGTGENSYEFLSPVHLPGQTLVLRLVLHTYRADAVIRRAELNLTILLSLLCAGWVLSVIVYRYAVRAESHQREMARQESLARLGEMGAMLAHEIRNPLAGIKGFAQIVERRPQDERNAGFARSIVAETLRLEGLVTDLLAYARSDRGTPVLFSLDELVAHAVSLVHGEADAQGVTISIACPEGVQLRGDRDRLGQVLLNLMKNALQAMPEGGILGIAAVSAGTGATVTVSDTGEGIDPGAMERIFEPFFTTRAKGTGLGLALCRKIVEEHGGTIDVQSTVGRGTTVTVTLPANVLIRTGS